MKKCNALEKLSKKKVCIPFGKKIKFKDGSIIILKSLTGYAKKILKVHSGTSKKNVYTIRHKNKDYISYIEKYVIPEGKSKKFIKLNEVELYSAVGKGVKKTLGDILREVKFSERIPANLSPKIVSSVLFLLNNLIYIQIITESASSMGFRLVGNDIDAKKLNLSFKLISPNNPPDPDLLRYMIAVSKKKKDFDFYARFLNPKYIEINLKRWYLKVSHFFIPFFIQLYKLHKVDIFHHDLHLQNIFRKGSMFKFIDFGRSSSLEETLSISFPSDRYKSDIWKIQHAEKKRISLSIKKNLPIVTRKNKENVLKCLMLTELNYPDLLKFKGIRQDYEFCRHDIDNGILLESFGRDHNFNKIGMEFKELHTFFYKKILLKFKYFIANKYMLANLH